MTPARVAFGRAFELARAVLDGSARDDEPQELARLVLAMAPRFFCDAHDETSDLCSLEVGHEGPHTWEARRAREAPPP
jgi:hypothetical protein